MTIGFWCPSMVESYINKPPDIADIEREMDRLWSACCSAPMGDVYMIVNRHTYKFTRRLFRKPKPQFGGSGARAIKRRALARHKR